MSIPEDSRVGYFLQCDLEYPSDLHELHSDLPFMPETKCPPNCKQKKLLTSLESKTHYVTHYLNLKQALKN